MDTRSHGPSMGRRVRAAGRNVRVVLREFRIPLFAFFAVTVAAGLLYRQLAILAAADNPSLVEVPGPLESVYLVLEMIFLQANTEHFPEQWPYLAAFFFVMPAIGLFLLSTGVANVGVLLVNKSASGNRWEAALASTYSDHIIVVGLGKIGYRVVLQLLQMGQAVVAVEVSEDKPFIPLARELGVPVIVGDARRGNTLMLAGLDRARSVVCLTQDDLTNLDVALDARERRPDIKVVLRMFEEDLARRVERGFGLHTAFSTSALAAPVFAAAATRAHIENSFYVDGELVHLAQVAVDPGSPLAGQTVEQAERLHDMTILKHRRAAGDQLHPQSDAVLQPGDGLVVVASLDTLERLGVTERRSFTAARRVLKPIDRVRRLLARRKTA
jgi:Trk K+ transport system NAD-binding subunit